MRQMLESCRTRMWNRARVLRLAQQRLIKLNRRVPVLCGPTRSAPSALPCPGTRCACACACAWLMLCVPCNVRARFKVSVKKHHLLEVGGRRIHLHNALPYATLFLVAKGAIVAFFLVSIGGPERGGAPAVRAATPGTRTPLSHVLKTKCTVPHLTTCVAGCGPVCQSMHQLRTCGPHQTESGCLFDQCFPGLPECSPGNESCKTGMFCSYLVQTLHGGSQLVKSTLNLVTWGQGCARLG